MQRSARTPTLFKSSQLAFHSLRWKPKWTPPPRFVALMNEDEDLDLIVVSTFDSLEVCCHEELLRMPINGLLRLIMDLNSRLSVSMQITDTLTKSEDQLRMDIEAVLGYKRFPPIEQKAPTLPSRDSGLGLLGILSAGQTPEARAVSSVPPRSLRQKGSGSSLNDRQKLTVSMRGKPRLSDLLEEELEIGNPGRSKGKSPIRRSDRQHSFIQDRGDRAEAAATLPRARNLRNLHMYEGRGVRFNSLSFECKQTNRCAQLPPRISGTIRQQPERSPFDAPAFGSILRAKPKLYHSLPTRRGKSPYEPSSDRHPKFHRGLQDAPSLGRRASRHTAPRRLRKPSLELFEMDQLICNMLSVSVSSVAPDRSRNTSSSLEEFGVL